MPASILIVDDEKHTREGLRQALEDDYEIYLAAGADEAFNLLETETFEVVLTDLKMAGKSGMKVIDRALQEPENTRPVTIMMTAYANVETAVEAMQRGAHDFLTKPVNLEKLEILIKRALRNRAVERENKNLHQRLDRQFSFDQIIGDAPALQAVLDQVKRVAPSRATVLLEGETGTGKELIAQAIHQNSDRSRQPFVAVHCRALNPNLLESELFGHERGAFTSAHERRIGRFEAADKGTLLLDEISEIDASTQVKLLRVLESRTFERLGSTKPMKVDVRLVAASNKSLEEEVEKGTFREDLFYRLNVVKIILPPLRERPGDIPALLDHFIGHFSQENGIEPVTLSDEVREILQSYAWRGNIRELRNFAENVVVMNRGRQITKYDLDPKFLGGSPAGRRPKGGTISYEDNEKRLLRDALVRFKGNRSQAAAALGISRRTLHRKLSQWPELDVR